VTLRTDNLNLDAIKLQPLRDTHLHRSPAKLFWNWLKYGNMVLFLKPNLRPQKLIPIPLASLLIPKGTHSLP